MQERLEELESLIAQLEDKYEKALAGGSERESNHIRKELKKLQADYDKAEQELYSCSCKS